MYCTSTTPEINLDFRFISKKEYILTSYFIDFTKG